MGDTLTVGGVSGTVLKTARRAANKTTVKFEVTANKGQPDPGRKTREEPKGKNPKRLDARRSCGGA